MHESWCSTCDPEIMIRKCTCGNKYVDCCIKEFQLRTSKYENVIEWIPFNKLSITNKIGEGGFGCVYFATWSDGKRKIENLYSNSRNRLIKFLLDPAGYQL
ncbi:hypothetical protein C2G38_2182898 [Gigaspora rosea]|uniref:Protein kinase domain-containing protein n=1 Tax=Gigaspora rosea TaxID=44941 RepID=A0A397VGM6_9GLOM|nr:hypothetical protein C2G38_2182898 [Gigaspora rosea]